MDKQKIFVVDDKDMIGKIIMACLGRDYDCRYFDSPKPVLEQMEAGDLPRSDYFGYPYARHAGR